MKCLWVFDCWLDKRSNLKLWDLKNCGNSLDYNSLQGQPLSHLAVRGLFSLLRYLRLHPTTFGSFFWFHVKHHKNPMIITPACTRGAVCQTQQRAADPWWWRPAITHCTDQTTIPKLPIQLHLYRAAVRHEEKRKSWNVFFPAAFMSLLLQLSAFCRSGMPTVLFISSRGKALLFLPE